MQTTICDSCGKALNLGYERPTIGDINFAIKDYKFKAEINKIIWQFNSTNKHFCVNCLMQGLSASLTETVEKYYK